MNASGKTIADGTVPALKAPVDYEPKTVEIELTAPAGTRLSGCCIKLDPGRELTEITRRNNIVMIK